MKPLSSMDNTEGYKLVIESVPSVIHSLSELSSGMRIALVAMPEPPWSVRIIVGTVSMG